MIVLALSFTLVPAQAGEDWDISRRDLRVRGVDDIDKVGSAVAAGSLDGDGHDDLLIGAARLDDGATLNVGGLLVFRGPDRLDSGYYDEMDAYAVVLGVQGSEEAGSSLTTGDFDGDGLEDVAVGAPQYDAGSGTDNGAVYVFFGPISGTLDVSSADVSITGANQARLGEALASGDLDGDGSSDLVIGAPEFGTGDPGRVHVFLGTHLSPATPRSPRPHPSKTTRSRPSPGPALGGGPTLPAASHSSTRAADQGLFTTACTSSRSPKRKQRSTSTANTRRISSAHSIHRA